jgi:hypothetical protein
VKFAHGFRWTIAAAASVMLVLLPASEGRGGDPSATLAVNPSLTQPLPPPGWLGQHRNAWIEGRPIYKSSCRTSEVSDEIRLLNRLVAYDEYLVNMTGPSVGDAPKAARNGIDRLRSDIGTADELATRLQMLPSCAASAQAAAPPAPVAADLSAVDAAAAAKTPQSAARTALAAAEAAAAAKTMAVTRPPPPEPATQIATIDPGPPPVPVAAEAGSPAQPRRIAIRFDDRMPALTPSGIRAFNEAVNALRSGQSIELAIDGCDAGADFSNGSTCARRRWSLAEMLAAAGIRDTKRLLAGIR